MLEQIEELIVGAAVAQTSPPPPSTESAPWVAFLVYAVIGLFILYFVVRGLRPKHKPPSEKAPAEKPVEREPTAQEIEDAARRTFRIPQVLVPEEPGTEATPPPEMRRAPPPEPPKPAPPRPSPTPSILETPRPRPAPPKPEPAKPAPTKPAPARKPEARKPEAPPKTVEAPPKRVEPAAPPPLEEAGKTLREGLARTHDGFVKRLGRLFGGAKALDDDLLAELEETLFTADIGVRTSQKLVELVHQELSKKDLKDPQRVWNHLKQEVGSLLSVDAPPVDLKRSTPFIIMIVGVNGAGKTTTIGKLARQFRAEGRRVLLAAGDTFRAAAVEQLEVWGERAGVPVVKGREGQDPASVAFEACKRAADEGFDVCICDTAGRLHARKELMDELGKVHRVMGKAVPGAPHEVWLVLDATNGQNAIAQAKEFTQVVQVTGLVMTKLDGTAKGGVIIGICDEMRIPVRYIGIGEKVEDLRPFDPGAFAEALFAEG
jgi:fused signal recognition particle receptor